MCVREKEREGESKREINREREVKRERKREYLPVVFYVSGTEVEIHPKLTSLNVSWMTSNNCTRGHYWTQTLSEHTCGLAKGLPVMRLDWRNHEEIGWRVQYYGQTASGANMNSRKLSSSSYNAPRANFQLKGHAIHLLFTYAIVTLRVKVCSLSPAASGKRGRTQKVFHEPQTWALLTAAEHQLREKRDKALSPHISIPVFCCPEVRERNTLHNPVANARCRLWKRQCRSKQVTPPPLTPSPARSDRTDKTKAEFGGLLTALCTEG